MTDEDQDTLGDLTLARAALILNLRTHGIVAPELLRAFEAVPHELFVPAEFAEYAYKEGSLPIDCGQSITSPIITARLLSLLEPQGAGKVLEIGTGSGYSAALLSRMAKRVFSIERFQGLANAARARWSTLGLNNIVGFHDDGLLGLVNQAPFERIFLTGSIAEVPEILTDQLADGGILVAPVGAPDERQPVLRIERQDDELITTEHAPVRLAPLTPGKARAL